MSEDEDPAQLRMDLDEANLRLDRIGKAIARKDDCEADVRRLTLELANAKRKLREAGYDLALLVSGERRAYAKKGQS